MPARNFERSDNKEMQFVAFFGANCAMPLQLYVLPSRIYNTKMVHLVGEAFGLMIVPEAAISCHLSSSASRSCLALTPAQLVTGFHRIR